MTKRSQKDFLNYLNVLKDRFERREGVQYYLRLQKMTQREKIALISEWDKYWVKVKNGKAAKRFWEQRQAYADHDFATVRRLGQIASAEAQAGYREFEPPSFEDPREIARNWDVLCWLKVVEKIEETKTGMDKDLGRVAHSIFGS